jgi:hypothetical protein
VKERKRERERGKRKARPHDLNSKGCYFPFFDNETLDTIKEVMAE